MKIKRNADDLLINKIKNHLETETKDVDIEHFDSIRNPNSGKKTKPIIAKFVRYNDRKGKKTNRKKNCIK